jgi:hypothetical protein
VAGQRDPATPRGWSRAALPAVRLATRDSYGLQIGLISLDGIFSLRILRQCSDQTIPKSFKQLPNC